MINKLAQEIYQNAKNKGFYDNPDRNIGEMLALVHSEVSEALEADRKNDHYNPTTRQRNGSETKWSFDVVDNSTDGWLNWFRAEVKNSFADELADAFIRILDLAEHKGINMEEHVKMKMRYNSLREYKHGKKY